MKIEKKINKRRERRKFRVRNQVRRAAHGRPRLSVFRSNRHMYAQIIDDSQGHTLVSASTMEKEVCGSGNYAGNVEAAQKVGKRLAERAMDKGIKKVVLDRGGCQFHGRVEALATAAREIGLEF